MACYGVETRPIQDLAAAIEALPLDVHSVSFAEFRNYGRKQPEQMQELLTLYLDALASFFQVPGAIARRLLELEQAQKPAREGSRPRPYLNGFLPLYDRASRRSLQQLRQVLEASTPGAPVLPAVIVWRSAQGGLIDEMDQLTRSVANGETSAEVQEHGRVAKEVTDSIKKSLKALLIKFIPNSRPARVVQKGVKVVTGLDLAVSKDTIEEAFRLMNEVLGMVFRVPGGH